jgi:hypothetical protein
MPVAFAKLPRRYPANRWSGTVSSPAQDRAAPPHPHAVAGPGPGHRLSARTAPAHGAGPATLSPALDRDPGGVLHDQKDRRRAGRSDQNQSGTITAAAPPATASPTANPGTCGVARFIIGRDRRRDMQSARRRPPGGCAPVRRRCRNARRAPVGRSAGDRGPGPLRVARPAAGPAPRPARRRHRGCRSDSSDRPATPKAAPARRPELVRTSRCPANDRPVTTSSGSDSGARWGTPTWARDGVGSALGTPSRPACGRCCRPTASSRVETLPRCCVMSVPNRGDARLTAPTPRPLAG